LILRDLLEESAVDEPENPPVVRLGKQPAKYTSRSRFLTDFVDRSKLPEPPAGWSWLAGRVQQWPLYLNDRLGDCVIASAAHMIELWTAVQLGRPVGVTDPDVLLAYEAVGGYRPEDPTTDRGCVMSEALDYWVGRGIGGHRIFGSTVVPMGDRKLIKTALVLFGGLYIGLQLPKTAQGQIGATWEVPPGGLQGAGARGSWGGHCVNLVSYDAHNLCCVTWGRLQLMSWNFFSGYCDEAHAVLSQADWIGNHAVSPSGFNLAALQVALRQVSW
jgi:hypothetical protein